VILAVLFADNNSRWIQDSGFRIWDSGFKIQDSGFLNMKKAERLNSAFSKF